MAMFGAGGAPRLERWKAFIFACISSGRPPVRMLECDDGGMTGRRAAFKVPSGVEEAVMLAVAGKSEVERRDGIRGLGSVASGRAKSVACVLTRTSVGSDTEGGPFVAWTSPSVVASAIAACTQLGRALFVQNRLSTSYSMASISGGGLDKVT